MKQQSPHEAGLGFSLGRLTEVQSNTTPPGVMSLDISIEAKVRVLRSALDHLTGADHDAVAAVLARVESPEIDEALAAGQKAHAPAEAL